jgi:hypothetical protein
MEFGQEFAPTRQNILAGQPGFLPRKTLYYTGYGWNFNSFSALNG